jgi:hypothetical protein
LGFPAPLPNGTPLYDLREAVVERADDRERRQGVGPAWAYRRIPLERVIEKRKLLGERCETSVFNDAL